MKHSSLDTQIRSRVDSLVAELTNTIRQATLEAVHHALGVTISSGSTAASPTATAPSKKRRGRPPARNAEQVANAAASLLAYIKANEGQWLHQIAKGMGTSTSDLKKPVQQLFAAKAIKTTGQRRGTKYYAR